MMAACQVTVINTTRRCLKECVDRTATVPTWTAEIQLFLNIVVRLRKPLGNFYPYGTQT